LAGIYDYPLVILLKIYLKLRVIVMIWGYDPAAAKLHAHQF
jgi:hypothetical protein